MLPPATPRYARPCDSPSGGDRLPGLGWAGLGASSWHCAARGLMLVFRLHSHLSLLLVSGTQGREVSILIFISGIGLCLLCRCLVPPLLPHVRPSLLLCRGAVTPRTGQSCPPACKPSPSTGGDDSLPPCVVCPVLPCWEQGFHGREGRGDSPGGCEPVWGSLGHRALGAQHTQTLTSLCSLCSPDEDSCQKFVPFVGVSVWGQWAVWAGGRGAVLCLTDAGDHLPLQVVKVGLVEQSFSASGESLRAHRPWVPSASPLLVSSSLFPPSQPTLFLPSGLR